MEYDDLMRQIKSAFADALAPAEANIVCHECKECLALRDSVRGHTPDELTDSWVEQNFDQLPLFSDEAKRFYLPAFLRVGALEPDSTVAQFVLYSLSNTFRMQPSGGYSSSQKQAVRDYLEYVDHRVDERSQSVVRKV